MLTLWAIKVKRDDFCLGISKFTQMNWVLFEYTFVKLIISLFIKNDIQFFSQIIAQPFFFFKILLRAIWLVQ